MYKNKGITLIALIITIIILLILATISISMITGENGILSKAKTASEQTKLTQEEEENRLSSLNTYIDNTITSRGDTSAVNNLANPILLTNAVLSNTGSGSRAAGTYKASSTGYTKTDTSELSKYLTFTQGIGWTVLKSGNYLFNSRIGSAYGSAQASISTYLLIGTDAIIIAESFVSSASTQGITSGNITVSLKEGAIIDYQFTNTAATTYNGSNLKIYAMFE
ncbi:hypothetical protein D3C72_1328530 [compost metagenome]